ncbi:hypothetical protein [Clostridium coskatii]|nr:hypothetical protein [Clostridium coskatii]
MVKTVNLNLNSEDITKIFDEFIDNIVLWCIQVYFCLLATNISFL